MHVGEAMLEPPIYLATHLSLSVVYFAFSFSFLIFLVLSHDLSKFVPLKKE